ncbi:hypothetical protein [Neosynechococcus sphagnicola]|uniref:hypothetical protein n=1 Tax=Neosynechococcus sphagnicola TaxID=1501145 RepID=UPI000AF1B9BE|nr:hypothetical protein [Neosynechococcus sphagnicola]
MIDQLTETQEEQISLYRQKWQRIALIPAPTDRLLARTAVQSVYTILNLSTPEILFRASPCAAIGTVTSSQFGNSVTKAIKNYYKQSLLKQVTSQLSYRLYQELHRRLWWVMHTKVLPIEFANQVLLYPLIKPLPRSQRNKLKNCVKPELWMLHGALLDFCISVLCCEHSLADWQAFQLLTQHCGWIYPYRKVCMICDRPSQFSFKLNSSSSSYLDLDLRMVSIMYNDGSNLHHLYDVSKDWLLMRLAKQNMLVNYYTDR